jgi:hypothetical protein
MHVKPACCHAVKNLLSSRLLSKNVTIKTYKTIVLPVVLCGRETSSLTLRLFENRVLRRISGTKRDEVTGDWKQLHNEQLHSFLGYSSSNRENSTDIGHLTVIGHLWNSKTC